MEKYCISVDWLQIYCNCNEWRVNEVAGDLQRVEGKKYVFHIELSDIHTQLWRQVYKVCIGKVEVATVCRVPVSSAIDKTGLTIKLSNRTLYSMQYVDILKDLITALNCRYKGVSRVDLCYDCNKLKGGIDVQKFLYDYLTAAPYQAGHIIRSGSSRVAMHAKRSKSGAMTVNSMRWGSPASSIGAYCYNKSLELLEVKNKPWIREVWERNGLIEKGRFEEWNGLSDKQKKNAIEMGSSTEYVDIPVWRFEVSVKTGGMDILNADTGELFRVNLDYLSVQEKLQSLFYMYASKVFDFRMSTGQKMIRYYPKMTLFEKQEQVNSRPYRISRYADTGRTEKICYNTLVRLQERYGDLSDGQRASLEAAKDFILTVAGVNASCVRIRRETDYLLQLKANRFVSEDFDAYFCSLEYLRKTKADFDPIQYESDFMSLYHAVVDEELRANNPFDGVWP